MVMWHVDSMSVCQVSIVLAPSLSHKLTHTLFKMASKKMTDSDARCQLSHPSHLRKHFVMHLRWKGVKVHFKTSLCYAEN